MGETQDNVEISGFESFLASPENYCFSEELFNNVEKYIYHRVDFGISIEDKDIYELGRYNGKAQILFEFGKYVIKKSNDEKIAERVAKAMFTVINNLSGIYVLLGKNIDMNRFGDILKMFKESVDQLNEIVLGYSDI